MISTAPNAIRPRKAKPCTVATLAPSPPRFRRKCTTENLITPLAQIATWSMTTTIITS